MKTDVSDQGRPTRTATDVEVAAQDSALSGSEPQVGKNDAAVAQALGEQVASAPRGRAFARIASLMKQFEFQRLTNEKRERMETALVSAGLTVEPSLRQVRRNGTVRLSRAAPDSDRDESFRSPAEARSALQGLVTATEWLPCERLRDVDLESIRERQGIIWFEVDNLKTSPSAVLEALNESCDFQLTEAMISDLFQVDPVAGVKRYSESPSVRSVSAVKVQAWESDLGTEDTNRSKVGVLAFQPVEFLVGERWLISCWQEQEVYRGTTRVETRDAEDLHELKEAVASRWQNCKLESSGDLGTVILDTLAQSYALARRQLYAWLEAWELDLYEDPDDIEEVTLVELRAAGALFRDWVDPLNRSGMREDPSKAWFPGVSKEGHGVAIRADDRIDDTLADLAKFRDTLRSTFELAQASSHAKQVRIAEESQEHGLAFERTLTKWATILLVPTFVTSFYGANEKLPLQEAGYWGTAAMIAAMIVLTAVALAVLSIYQNRQPRSPSAMPPDRITPPRA